MPGENSYTVFPVLLDEFTWYPFQERFCNSFLMVLFGGLIAFSIFCRNFRFDVGF